MPMKNPPHPGRLIRDEIEALGLSIAEAAEGLKITRQQLYRIISGQCGLTPEMAIRLEQGLGGSAVAWLKMQMNYDLAQTRAHKTVKPIKRLKARAA
jgi:addiction module HigA family antidote